MKSKLSFLFVPIFALGCIISVFGPTQTANAQTYYTHTTPGSSCVPKTGGSADILGTPSVNYANMGNVSTAHTQGFYCPLVANGGSVGAISLYGWATNNYQAFSARICNNSGADVNTCSSWAYVGSSSSPATFAYSFSDLSTYNPSNFNYIETILWPQSGSSANDIFGYSINLTR